MSAPKKLLHERLRELASVEHSIMKGVPLSVEAFDDFALQIADEIERYYIPRPRFEDGDPVHTGDETDRGIAWVIAVFGDGDWHVHTIDGTILESEDYGSGLKRPSPKVLDADGVEIKEGDTVWDIRSGSRFDVTSVPSSNCVHTAQGHSFVHPDETLTHKEPDSLGAIHADIFDRISLKMIGDTSEGDYLAYIAHRIGAIMGRDA